MKISFIRKQEKTDCFHESYHTGYTENRIDILIPDGWGKPEEKK